MPANWLKNTVTTSLAVIMSVGAAVPAALVAGTVRITVLVDVVIVGSEVNGTISTPAPAETLDLSIVSGKTTPEGNWIVMVPVPATSAAETPNVTFHEAAAFTLRDDGVNVTS